MGDAYAAFSKQEQQGDPPIADARRDSWPPHPWACGLGPSDASMHAAGGAAGARGRRAALDRLRLHNWLLLSLGRYSEAFRVRVSLVWGFLRISAVENLLIMEVKLKL